jgi:hypothetical protein
MGSNLQRQWLSMEKLAASASMVVRTTLAAHRIKIANLHKDLIVVVLVSAILLE